MTSQDNVFPTKGNLLAGKKSLHLAKVGYELLDRKRNILIREMMSMLDSAGALRGEIDQTYKRAYTALQRANITLGICDEIADSVAEENGLEVQYRSVMGVELPTVSIDCPEKPRPIYSLDGTNSQLDYAYLCFHQVKLLTVKLAEIENSIYRLAQAIKKTQGRANALQNIVIPKYNKSTKYITESLEEKEREEFSRLKVIKTTKERRQGEGFVRNKISSDTEEEKA